jgi:hypothetical protein
LILREESCFAFPAEKLQLNFDVHNGRGCSWVKGVVLDVIPLLSHVPTDLKSFLNEENGPAPSHVLLVQGVDMALLCVQPFASHMSKQQLAPAKQVLFAHCMLSTPLVMILKSRKGTIAKFPPALSLANNGLDDAWSGFKHHHFRFKFLDCQGKCQMGTSTFAFHNVSRAFHMTAARAVGRVLIPLEKFASSCSTPACSVFQKPALFPKWKASHDCCTSLPIDVRDQLRRETVFAVPAFSSATSESFFLSIHNALLQAGSETRSPGLGQGVCIPDAFGKAIAFDI